MLYLYGPSPRNEEPRHGGNPEPAHTLINKFTDPEELRFFMIMILTEDLRQGRDEEIHDTSEK